MSIETVRVVNPNQPSSFMTINKHDMRPHHELWPEQTDPAPIVALVPTAEIALAMKLAAHVIAVQGGTIKPDDWLKLSVEQQTLDMERMIAHIADILAKEYVEAPQFGVASDLTPAVVPPDAPVVENATIGDPSAPWNQTPVTPDPPPPPVNPEGLEVKKLTGKRWGHMRDGAQVGVSYASEAEAIAGLAELKANYKPE